MVQIGRWTSRAGQSALKTATPSSPGYDGGAHFLRRAHQGSKKLARIKILVDDMYGDKTLSIIQTNPIIRAVKDEKRPIWQKKAADVIVAISAALFYVWWQNHRCSFRHKGSGYVPADFQADKSQIVIPGPVFVEGRRTSLCRHLIARLLMVAKGPRHSTSLPICRIRLRPIFFCFREAKFKPTVLLLSQGGLMKNLEGVARSAVKTSPPPPFSGI